MAELTRADLRDKELTRKNLAALATGGQDLALAWLREAPEIGPVSLAAAASASRALTTPKPICSFQPPFGRVLGVVLLVIAEMTWASVSCGWAALISATTPAVSAHAGLVPLT